MLLPVVASLLCLATSFLAPDQDGTATAPRSVQWMLPTDENQSVSGALLERWDKRSDDAQSDLEKFDVKLASANWLLSRQIAVPASRVLLGLATKSDLDQIGDALNAAQTRLDAADEFWAKVVKSGELADAHDSERAKNLDGLHIMHDAFKSLWPTDNIESDDRDESMRNAANRLSTLLINDRMDVLAAAQLWQGYLYIERGKLDGALELWPKTLSPLSPPFSVNLYTRLIQCRTAVQKDHVYTAGVALLTNLEQSAIRRMSDAQMAVEAQATVAFVRRQLLANWRKKLSDEGELDRAAWCSQMVEKLDVDHDQGNGTVKMLALEFAAPDFVNLDRAILQLDEPPKRSPSTRIADDDAADMPAKDVTTSGENEDTDAGDDNDSHIENPGG
ncbi:MAG: hypothetical protein R3E58_05755 [Phycisphaerae bacterium]|nr:hypothetical protein [Phycisphaerales bacterium]